jgi:hypothetical protein
VVDKRTEELDDGRLANAIAREPSERLVASAITRIINSTSWSTNNTLLPVISSQVESLTAEDMVKLCAAAVSNYEIYQANAADAELKVLFGHTFDWTGAGEAWLSVANFRHPHAPGEPFAFPAVRYAVGERWGQQVLTAPSHDAG